MCTELAGKEETGRERCIYVMQLIAQFRPQGNEYAFGRKRARQIAEVFNISEFFNLQVVLCVFQCFKRSSTIRFFVVVMS
jgi:hypothetical protein